MDLLTSGADPAMMGQLNAINTLRVLYARGPLTLTQLTDATGLARTTAEAAVGRLMRRKLVAQTGPSDGTRRVGRPARTFRFRPEAGYALGVSIGARRVSAILADLCGTTVAGAEVNVYRGAGRSERIDAARSAARRCADAAGVALSDVWAATVGTPGLVENGSRVSLCRVLPDWSGFSLAEAFEGIVTGPVTVENDTNLSAVAERWRGVVTDVDDVVWALIGRRFSAAILIGGALYRGADGAAGEIGWLPELGWPAASEHQLSLAGAGGKAGESIITRAVEGDPGARDQIDEFARSLAPGLTALVLAINPRCLVLGGGIAAAGEIFLTRLAEHMRPHCLRLPELRTSILGDDSVALGAVRLSLDVAETRLFGLSQ